MRPSRLVLLHLVLVASGCVVALPPAENPPPATGPTTQRAPVQPSRVQPETAPTPTPTTEPTTSETCEIAFRTSTAPTTGGRVHLVVTAVNLTDHAITTAQTSRCPGPLARFEGLPAGYDVGGTCLMGACIAPTSRTELTLRAGEERVVAEAEIEARGDSCNSALPAGEYTVLGAVSLENVSTCVTQRTTLHVGAPPNAHPSPHPHESPDPHEPCPPVACRYNPCPPGRSPPPGCAGQCGCH